MNFNLNSPFAESLEQAPPKMTRCFYLAVHLEVLAVFSIMNITVQPIENVLHQFSMPQTTQLTFTCSKSTIETIEKHERTKGFLTFSGGIEM